MGADFLGFQVNKDSPDYISPEVFRNLAGWVSGPRLILEVDQASDPAELQKISEAYGISNFLVDNPETKKLSETEFLGLKITSSSTKFREDHFSFIVLDNNLQADELLTSASKNQVFITTNGSIDLAQKLLNRFPSIGFAVNGSKEIQPGLADYQVRELLEFLDED